MEDALKSALLPIAALLLLNSCSWYRDLERSLVEDDEKQQKRSRVVSREQYDQLLVKYEELSKKYEQLKEGNPKENSLVDELQNSSGQNFANTSPNVETVDAFGAGGVAAPATTPVISNIEVPTDVESQLTLYRKGVALRSTNSGEATKIFQQLETQSVPAVKVRSKLQIGEILLEKGHYDLALQVFEDIISKYAESGAVLDALRNAVVCSDKLGIQNKKDQYASMLKDVFEAN